MRRLVLVALFALIVTPQAAPQTRVPNVPAPKGLRAFQLQADEPISHSYPRTPSFSWQPVAASGGHYDFELATSRSFEDSSIVFKDTKVPIPAEAIARQLPWLTGDPYALWAHVRWVSNNGQRASQWSAPFGLNLQWRAQDVPHQLPAPEGLICWQPIEGATAYEVLYPDLVPAKSFETTTNVADEREFFTFHNALGYATIHWRVRAIRTVSATDTATNGLPAVSYGPWSPVFTTVNAPQTPGTLAPTDTVSDAWDKGKTAHAHELTPGFAWTPSAPVISQGVNPGSSLYRVYIFTDKDCVNRVFTGSIVGSPAWAPRTEGGPMALPGDTASLTLAESAPPFLTSPGSEGIAVDATGDPVTSNETAGSQVGAAGAKKPAAGAGLAGVDLWDSGWPSGRYYWTVVPVSAEIAAGSDPTKAAPITYHDLAVPQDSCQAGLSMSFGKTSQPVVTADGAPYISGVSPTGHTIAVVSHSTPVVYESPLIAWQPAAGAAKYQIQLSRRLYPWAPTKTLGTDSTSIVLPLGKNDAGTWYYRVRGVDPALPVGAQKMSWSQIVPLRVTGDRFTIVK